VSGPTPLPDPAYRLSRVVKSYDVRGLVPSELDPVLAYAIGCGLADLVAGNGRRAPERAAAVVLGRDMRSTSPALAAALADGVRSRGLDVVDIGLSSTDQLYFASGSLDLPGAMVTASHNPAGWNGVKLCRSGARPIGRHTGLDEVRDVAASVLSGEQPTSPLPRGGLERRDVLEAYASHLLGLAPVPGGASRRRVVVDAGNGMAGHTAPAVFARLDVELVPLYFELDGRFPHHEANPLDPSTLVDLQAAVRRQRADVGLAFDGDADRCFFIDERGQSVSPSAITSLIAVRELAREPGAVVLHNLICSRAVPQAIRASGGTPVRTPVGHSVIKQQMADTGAIFGGEHSGHYYFRDFWSADSGMLAALHVLAALSRSERPLSRLVESLTPYASSGEINSTVGDPVLAMRRVEAAYAGRPDVRIDSLDGISVEHDDWGFNVRPSGTEPLVRLNVEAVDSDTMASVRDRVLAIVRSAG
jgi:phosphomannomutase